MFTHMRIAKPVTNIERSFLMYSQGWGCRKLLNSTTMTVSTESC